MCRNETPSAWNETVPRPLTTQGQERIVCAVKELEANCGFGYRSCLTRGPDTNHHQERGSGRLNMKTGIIAVAVVALLAGCSSSSTAPLAPFQPQINNAADNFQFQATGVQLVTTTLTYTWQNSGTGASVNQSTTVSAGSATVVLYDSTNTMVYSRSLADNGTFAATTGVAGAWTVKVILMNYSGTINFRVQKA